MPAKRVNDRPTKPTDSLSRLRSPVRKQNGDAERQGTQLLGRALAILSAFTMSEPRLSLADLMRKTGVNKATLLRLIATLLAFDYLRKTEAGLYHVGPAVLQLARIYRASVRDGDLIENVLESLVERSGESASFHIRDGVHRVCIHRVNSRSRVRDHAEVGDVLPLERGAIGRMLLAFTSDKSTPELDQVRTTYVCALHGDVESEASGVVVPVFREGGFAGALAVTGPTYRFDHDTIECNKQLLFDASLRLTEELGGDLRAMRAAWER